MDIEIVVDIFRQAVTMILIMSAPMLVLGLAVGLIVSIFQATTQIQEATLSFVPKIAAVLISMVVFAPFLIATIVDFTSNLFMNINSYIM